jgi:glycosyltransferase 2 family protein
MKSKISNWIKIIGLILFVFILTRLDLEKAAKGLVNFKWIYLFVYVALSVLMQLFKSFRWNTLLKKQGIKYQLKKVYKINVFTSFLGLITPGRLGELSKVVYLQEDGVPFSISIVSVLIDRIYDLMILFIFGVAAFFYFSTYFLNNINNLILTVIVFVAFALLIFLFRNNIWIILKRALKYMLPDAKYNLLSKEWIIFKAELIKVFLPTMAKMIFYSTLIYFCYYAQINLVAYGFNVSVSFIYLSFCMTLASLISLLPISIGGLGTREAVFILLLSKVAIPAESAVLISFIDGSVLALLVMSVLAAVNLILFKKERLS